MIFRPLPVLTSLTALVLAVLVTLGIWQISRMQDKAEAIAQYEAGNRLAPVSLEDALCGGDPTARGQRVLAPQSGAGPALAYFGRSETGAAGWRIFQPVPLPACARAGAEALVLAETGFRTDDGGETMLAAPLTLARPPGRTIMDAPNDPDSGQFYHFDAAEMAAYLGVDGLSGDIWLTARSAELPPELAQTPPSRHLGYALTWFGFALTLIGVYIAFHVSRNRLGFTRR